MLVWLVWLEGGVRGLVSRPGRDDRPSGDELKAGRLAADAVRGTGWLLDRRVRGMLRVQSLFHRCQ
jgi:hypothetical protein